MCFSCLPSHPPGYGVLSYGGSGASGSGERGQDAGRRLSVSYGTRARSYWFLVLTKPKSGEHGARGASWRDKSPFWMSSTQWGVVETVWAEGSVAGSMGAALATLLLCLWACLYGNRGLTFWLQASRRASAHRSAFTRVFRSQLCHCSTVDGTVRTCFSCLPSHPPGYAVLSYGGSLASGSGKRGQGAGRLLSVSLGTRARSKQVGTVPEGLAGGINAQCSMGLKN